MKLGNVPAPNWIVTNAELVAVCERWRGVDYLIIDTEFVRTTTFYPKAGLLQVANGDTCWLIDPLSINEWQPLAEILSDSSIVKVFHACAEDLEVCKRLVGVVPNPMFDTQLAMAFVGLGSSVGFQRAVSGLLNLDIPKEETRSDWLKRPLSETQIEYATADVFYLQPMYLQLRERLASLNRTEWHQAECDRITAAAQQTDDDFSQAYRRVKLAWKLRPNEQYVLQQLSIWREEQARLRDVPRNKIVDDQTLWNISRFKAGNRDQLTKAGVRPYMIREAGGEILRIVNKAVDADGIELPEELDKPLSIPQGTLFKKMRQVANDCAETHQLPAEIVANKRLLEALIRQPDKASELLTGWRMMVIGAPIMKLLSQHAGVLDRNTGKE